MSEKHRVDTAALMGQLPLLRQLQAYEELAWFNPLATATSATEGLERVGLPSEWHLRDAADRLRRFAPYLAQVFPETAATYGIIESPIVGIPAMQTMLGQRGQLWAKLDSHLPVAGSVKARGGIYEVLTLSEGLAFDAGLITEDGDYRVLASQQARRLFSRYRIAVGSTGNLGLSIGIMGATLGFRVTVHMSADARQWKKELLRSHGVEVIEHDADYSFAVAQGRKAAEADPDTFFIDDEHSRELFLGYAVAGLRFAGQLVANDIRPTRERPLFVYLPCGVGGAPGGIAFGLKSALGDTVRCIFAEPSHSPAMLLGVYTLCHGGVSLQDLGIDNSTAADGLAVGRASDVVLSTMPQLIDGYYTVDDATLFRLLSKLDETEGIRIEPSAAAGLIGPSKVAADMEYLAALGLDEEALTECVHVAWLTGGSMVPEEEMADYLARGRAAEAEL